MLRGLRHRKRALEMPHRFPSFVRGLLMAAVSAIVLLVILWFWQNWDPDAFMRWREQAGPVPFFIALSLLPAIGFPTTPFYVVAGATFSPMVNFIGISVSLAVHVAMCYWVANSWMRKLLEKALSRTRYNIPVLEKGSALRFALLVKMAPGVPTFVKNYVIGMSGISFPMHFLVCFGITGLYAAAFVILGDSLVDRDMRTGAIGLGLLIAVVVALYFLRRHLKGGSDKDTPPPFGEKPAS